MCNLGCKNCNKNNIYLGTSVQNLESITECGDFEGVIFTDCVYKAREDAYQKEVLGKESVVVAHAKFMLNEGSLEEISDDDYGYHIFAANACANLTNLVTV